MKHKELYDLLKTLNIPVAYDHFESNKNMSPPFIAYREMDVDTFKADGKTYYRPYEFEIELVTATKDVSLEGQVETLLTENNIPYDVDSSVWDNEEKIYHTFYEI